MSSVWRFSVKSLLLPSFSLELPSSGCLVPWALVSGEGRWEPKGPSFAHSSYCRICCHAGEVAGVPFPRSMECYIPLLPALRGEAKTWKCLDSLLMSRGDGRGGWIKVKQQLLQTSSVQSFNCPDDVCLRIPEKPGETLSVWLQTVVGREETWLVAEAAARAAILAAAVSCCSSQYLPFHVVHVILLFSLFFLDPCLLRVVSVPLFPIPVRSDSRSASPELSSLHSLACSSTSLDQSCESWPAAIARV